MQKIALTDMKARHSKSVKISTSALFAPKNSTKKRVNPSAIKFATKHRKRLFFPKRPHLC